MLVMILIISLVVFNEVSSGLVIEWVFLYMMLVSRLIILNIVMNCYVFNVGWVVLMWFNVILLFVFIRC